MYFKREGTNRLAGRWGYLSNVGKAFNLTVDETRLAAVSNFRNWTL